MNHQKSKFSLIFRVIALMLIQAFLVMDIAWAAGGELPFADNKASVAATLSPKISLNSQEIIDAYIYTSPVNLSEVAPYSVTKDQVANQSGKGGFLSTTWKKISKMLIVGAFLVTASGLLPAPAAATRPGAFSDVLITVNNTQLNEYEGMIKASGVAYTIEKEGNQTVFRFKGLVPLAAEKLSGKFKNAQVVPSRVNFEQSQAYARIQKYVEGIENIYLDLGLGTIDKSMIRLLAEHLEAITGVESNFNHWETDKDGNLVIKSSFTKALGIKQLLINKAVFDLAKLLVENKLGRHHLDLIAEIRKMVSSNSENVIRAIKANQANTEPSVGTYEFSIYNNILAYKKAGSDAQRIAILKKIHTTLNSNPNLMDVDEYYLLAVLDFLQKQYNLQVGVDGKVIQSMAKNLVGVDVKTAPEDPSGFRPSSLAQANKQFKYNVFISELLTRMIDPVKVMQILDGKGTKDQKLDAMMQYLSELMKTQDGNDKMGSTFYTYLLFTFMELEKAGDAENFPYLAAAAAYNSGFKNVTDYLEMFGPDKDANHIPLWIKNIQGSGDIVLEAREYIRKVLEHRALYLGNLSEKEENIKNKLILWRYQCMQKLKDGSYSPVVTVKTETIKGKVRQTLVPSKRNDKFDYKLAARMAEVFGSENVDPFINSYGFDNWEPRFFNDSKILDILADILANKDLLENTARYAEALKVRNYLNEKQIAALDDRIKNIKGQQVAEAARIALAEKLKGELSQDEKTSQTQTTLVATEKSNQSPWMIRTALAALSLTIVGAVAWIMSKRLNFDKTAVLPFILRLGLKGGKLLGYGTILGLVLIGKLFVIIASNVFSFPVSKKSNINRPSVLANQKVVNRRVEQSVVSRLIVKIKNLLFIAVFLVIIAAPFGAPVFSHASQKQPQAPPVISLTQQQPAIKKELVISENGQLDAQGQLRTIRANLQSDLDFSNGSARKRVEKIKQLMKRKRLSAFIRGELPEYMINRGDSEAAIAINDGLFILREAAPKIYQGLEENKVSIYIGKIPAYGYVRGSRFFGLTGKPIIFINEKFINDPFKIALILAFNGRQAIDFPQGLWELAKTYNIATLFRDMRVSIPDDTAKALAAQKEFAAFFNITPIKGDLFYDSEKLEITYYDQKGYKVALDLIGTGIFIFALMSGWLIFKTFKSKGPSNKLGNNRRGNYLRSIILIPLLALQLGSILNPTITQASDALVLLRTQQKVYLDYKNEHNVDLIQGTNIEIHTHSGNKEGKHNNVLGDWAEAVVNGVLQPNADIVRFDWHDDFSGGVMDYELDQWKNLKNLKTPQEKIDFAREIASNIRIDAFNYLAYLDGPNGQPILGTTYWVRQEAESEGPVKEQYFLFAELGPAPITDPQSYPGEITIKKYNLNAKDLSSNQTQIKDGFILDFDLDYFKLRRSNYNWTFLNELINSQDEAKRNLAKITLSTIRNQPDQKVILENIAVIKNQLKQLADRGIKPAIIDIAYSPNFTAHNDDVWISQQLVKALNEIYGQAPALAVKDQKVIDVKQKTLDTENSGVKKFGIIGFVSVISASLANLFSAANLWALETGADKAFASSDLKSIVVSLVAIAMMVFIVKWGLKAIGLSKQKLFGTDKTIVVPSKAALGKIKKLDNDIKALFSQGKTRAVVVLDGDSDADKINLAEYIKSIGIAGIDPLEIQIISQDEYAQADIEIRGKLVLVLDAAYDNPDILVKITGSEQLPAQPSGDFDIIVEQPYNKINLLRDSAEYQKADIALKTYANQPDVEKTRGFALEQMLSSGYRNLVLYHNEHHLNELLNFSDSLSEYMPFQNKDSAQRLGRIAIYLHDMGYFNSKNGLLGKDHEKRSKEKALEFAAANPGLLSEIEVQALIYMIDKTEVKLGAVLAKEIAADNQAYDLLNKLDQQQDISDKERKDLNDFVEKNFARADLENLNDRRIIMDTILNGKILALADIWGQEETYLYLSALLSEEFRHDKNIMLMNNDPKVAENPAAMTNLEQVGGTIGFQNFVNNMRLKFFLENDNYPALAMQQYLDAEQKAKQTKGVGNQSLIDRRNAMLEKSKNIQSHISTLLSGFDQNNTLLNLNKKTEDLPQVKGLLEFIEQGFRLGIYDQARKQQLIEEINKDYGFIGRGIDNQGRIGLESILEAKYVPSVNEAVKASGLAESLNERELSELLSALEIMNFSQGQVIINQGDTSKDVFLLIQGDLDIVINGYRVGNLSDGKLFGEMAIVQDVPRIATVSVSDSLESSATVARIPEAVFRGLLNKNKQVAGQTKKMIEERKIDLNEFFAAADRARSVPIKPADDPEQAKDALKMDMLSLKGKELSSRMINQDQYLFDQAI